MPVTFSLGLGQGTSLHLLGDSCVSRVVLPEMTVRVARAWLGQVGARTLYIELGSPWENSYCESFIGKLWDETLSCEIF